MLRLLLTILGALPVQPASADSAIHALGVYRCAVQNYYGTDFFGKKWVGADLLFDADAGTLDGSFDPGGALESKGIRLPQTRLFSRLIVEMRPSSESSLYAVQYESVIPDVTFRPLVVWLKIETIDSEIAPPFKFFSNTIEGLVEGRCARGH